MNNQDTGYGALDFAEFMAYRELVGEAKARIDFGLTADEDPLAHFGLDRRDILEHYGTPRHSGRYPWGSGDNPYQRYADFTGNVERLRAKGMSDTEIAKSMNMKTSQLRAKIMLAEEELRKERVSFATKLREKGYSLQAIADRMQLPNESSVRSLLNQESSKRMMRTEETLRALKTAVEDKKYVDVGGGVEKYLGISETKLKNACELLKEQGYKISSIRQRQQGTENQTTIKVLTKDDVPYGEIAANKDKISIPNFYSEDHGYSLTKLEPPRPIDASRIKIRYADDDVSGKDRDGLIELRPGVPDISLGNALYAQVRIATKETPGETDPSHYLKGMARYGDPKDFPPGVDVIFNTNKNRGTDPFGKSSDSSVFKPIKSGADPTNPFGATVRDDDELIRAQRHYIDENGKKQLSCLNIVNEEGNWGDWSRNLSSQFLSKQRPSLIKQQLDLAYKEREEEFKEIQSLTNPVLKTKLAESFADDCDAAASHLKGASMPRQRTQVILPFPGLKEDECYAPNFNDGEKVALIRYPHGGRFEIAELTVNNRYKEAADVMTRPNGEKAMDMIGIHPKAAEKLSGADFDGDTVIVIPNNDKRVLSKPQLEELKGFSTDYYKLPDDAPPVDMDHGFHKQKQMGSVSNLITDMTIKGASDAEIARAVKHSMVVIDAEKHHLDWKRSELDNGIAELKTLYQGGPKRGASTLISRASSEEDPYARKLVTNPKRMTPEERERFYEGYKIWQETGRTYTNKDGKEVRATVKSTKMAERDDAFELSSGTLQETIYAEFANKLKHLARESRKLVIFSEPFEYDPSAKAAYANEVKSLNDQLYIAELNRPLERKAQLLANKMVKAVKEADPTLDADDIKKLRGRKITEARARVGAGKTMIKISDKEWEAIQHRAISKTKLIKILNNTDLDEVKQRAMPRNSKVMSDTKISRAKSMLKNGATTAEVAETLGVSVSTIQRALNPKENES